jgi:predicted nuclease of restriction endonuclease-like RecB superfamily
MLVPMHVKAGGGHPTESGVRSSSELAPRTNLALVQGLLARAERVSITLLGNAIPVVRRAKCLGLIVNVDRPGDATRITVSGPLALFHHTRIYGRALGAIAPLLAWSTRFELVAWCRIDEGRKRLQIVSGDPIFPSTEPVAFDSTLEERFARAIRRAAPGWHVIRDPEPLVADDGLVFPDFALVDRDDGSRRWLVEIVGFWTPAYIARKLAAYRAVDVPNLVLCMDARHGCGPGELPAGVRVVWFRRRIDPKAVLAAMGISSVSQQPST